VSGEGPWRWRLRVEYDGTNFVGWQRQPDQRSVQAVLETAVVGLFGHEAIVVACGRTDAGVHALAQVVAFTATRHRQPTEVRDGLNAYLPDDVAVVEALIAPLDFEPRHWVSFKEYRYLFLNRPSRSPLFERTTWHVKRPLDVELMERASACLIGQHDFSSFRAAGCQASHPMRNIESIRIVRRGDLVEFAIVGHGFLRHMIRIMAGTLVDVGLGRKPPEWVSEVLESRDRTKAGRTAPAKGLCLAVVEMGERSHKT
jgi:tRNA pseudouridine38-40 synthase